MSSEAPDLLSVKDAKLGRWSGPVWALFVFASETLPAWAVLFLSPGAKALRRVGQAWGLQRAAGA